MTRFGKNKVKDKDQGSASTCSSSDDASSDSKKSKEENVERVSLFQLFRYATPLDVFLLILGSGVAIATGTGFPLMAIIIGDTSQTFIYIQTWRTDHNASQLPHGYDGYHQFNHDVIQGCLKYTFLGIAIFIASTVQVSCFMFVSENVMNRLRRHFFRAVLRQNIAYFDENHTGTMAPKLFDNLERVKEGTGDKLALLIQFLSQFFAGFGVAFGYDWRLTLIMMSLSPLLIACGVFIGKMMASSAQREQKMYATAGGVAEEAISSIRTVAAFNGLEYECKRYESALEDSMRIGIRKSFLVGLGLGCTFFILFATYALAFWVGTDYVYWGMLKPQTVLTTFFGVMMGSMALGQAGPQFGVLGTALGAAHALYEVIDRQPEIDSYSEAGQRPAPVRGHIKVSGVQFAYPTRPDVPILNGQTLEVLPGQTVALVGASGCGKSTLVQLLLRYYDTVEGEITIDGIPIREWNLEHLRQTIGVVSQEPILFNTTIEENIRYGREDVTEAEIVAALHKANAFNFVSTLPEGLHTLVGDRGTQLSGGQKQRIAIARALVRDPRILLLDEATSALDAESESIVQQALEKASQGRTTIVIAHRLSTIRTANCIFAMKGGHVIESGTHDDLMERKGLYFDLVNAQVFTDLDDSTKRRGSSQFGRQDSQRQRGSSGGGGIHRQISEESQTKKRRGSGAKKGGQTPAAGGAANKKDDKNEMERLKNELAEEGASQSNLLAILRVARPEWWLLVVGTIACLVNGCVFPAYSLFFTQILDVFSETDNHKLRRDGHFWALMFLVLATVEGVTMLMQASLFGTAAERLTKRLRVQVFRNVMRQDMTYFDMPAHSAGKICTRLATDAPNVKSAIDYRLGSVFGAVVSVGCGIGIAFYFDYRMALVMLGTAPLVGFGQALQFRMFQGKDKTDSKSMEEAGKLAIESIEYIRTVQALTLERKLFRSFCEHLDGPHRTAQWRSLGQGLVYGFSNSVFYFLYAISFRFGAFLVKDHDAPPMDVLRVLFAISFCTGSVGFASAYFSEYVKATLAGGLIFKMLREVPIIDGMSQGGKRGQIHGQVDAHSLKFAYPQRSEIQVLRDLSLSVKPGETLALVGPSGCGKSTIVSLLERFYNPDGGELLLDNEKLDTLNIGHIRSRIALVSQEPVLFDTSIRENILYGLPPNSVTTEQLEAAARTANVHDFVVSLPEGYETRVGEKGAQLSGGQKQRVAIARALIRQPALLLLDEATSALDAESEAIVQRALDAAAAGRTVICIAHRLSTVVNANTIAVIQSGQVVEKGNHAELMAARGAYYNLTLKQQHPTKQQQNVVAL